MRPRQEDSEPRPTQLALFGEPAAATARTEKLNRLTAALDRLTQTPVRLIVTDNRFAVITVRRLEKQGVQVRLHQVFLEADPETVLALAGFIRRPDRRNRKVIGAFVRQHLERIRAKPARKKNLPVETRGKVYDLREIFHQVQQTYGISAPEVRIGWGRRTGKRRFRSLRFGSYDEEEKLIRVHPLLDRKEVPRFFVEFIVYHELLHAVVPEGRGARGRRLLHPPEFKRRERLFADYPEALAFEKRFVRERASRRRW